MSNSYIKSKALRVALIASFLALLTSAVYFGREKLFTLNPQKPVSRVDEEGEESGHAHSHPGHSEQASLELSQQARSNIGLTLLTVSLQPFERTISLPGIITERPGRTSLEVTAPMTGVVTRIAAVEGEGVAPGQLLAEMRLTHEELVQAQGEMLRTAESLDVTKSEIRRIEKVVQEGAIPGKTLIDLNYERQKAEAVLRAQSQTLLLHGFSDTQVATILETRKLLNRLSVTVPQPMASDNNDAAAKKLQVQELRVAQGQHVNAGDVLFVLADHRELFIEGRAFEQDVQSISNAAANDWTVSALVESKSTRPEDLISGLSIIYMANKVDPESRTFRFYVALPNRVLREKQTDEGLHFLDWQYRPGQRVQVRVPVELWKDRIVLPIEAVAHEGNESFVFQANGDHFDRRPVHIEYRDQMWAVIANDGSLYPGDIVAQSGAFQLQTALKNKAGGAVDPHAGHNH